jgi:NAD(P)-dependent dehydrogenase (short-subunit alcohol dehydrogenase family)
MTNSAPVWSDRFNLTGRVALITGGTRGLGRAMAEGLAQAGAEVIIASRKADACESVAAQIAATVNVRVIGLPCHVGHWDECTSLVDKAYAAFGGIDILINNAGMSPLYPSLGAVSEELFDKVIGVNLKGPFRLSALIGSRMAEDKGGSIINIASTAAVEPMPHELPYAAAKAGLNALTLGLARAFAPKVRVNSIMPGPFLTDVAKAWDMDEFARRTQDTIALQRGGQAGEIVGAALYLASAASSYTTGAVIKVDGGAAYSPA